MFKPQYRITDHCLSLIRKITELTTRIGQTNVAFSQMARLQREAINRNVHASTSIEGNILSLVQVSALSENRDVDADVLQKREVSNYLEALRWVVKKGRLRITEKKLLHLHAMIVKGLVPDKKAGSYKNRPNYVIDEKKVVVYRPPSSKKCPGLLQELTVWVNKKSNIHPVILSGVFHHQFVSIHPFSDGNGRLARAASQWILYHKQFDPQHILSLDDFYSEDRKRYYEKIQQARDLDYDLTHWIEYVAEGVCETVEKVYSRIKKLSLSSGKKIVVTPRQEELVELLNMKGTLSSSDISRFLKINRARVNQLISPLVKARIVNKEGKARATRYFLNEL